MDSYFHGGNGEEPLRFDSFRRDVGMFTLYAAVAIACVTRWSQATVEQKASAVSEDVGNILIIVALGELLLVKECEQMLAATMPVAGDDAQHISEQHVVQELGDITVDGPGDTVIATAAPTLADPTLHIGQSASNPPDAAAAQYRAMARDLEACG